MPAIIEPKSELIPGPATVAALVAQLVEGTWPSTDEERETLFRHLLFESGERLDHDSDASSTASYTLLTDLPGISFASWNLFHGRFMSVHFHLYTFPKARAPETRLGHHAVSGMLTDLYGPPSRPWEDKEVPPSIWKVNHREIVTHLFTTRESSLMLSISDGELAVAAEAEATHETGNSDRIVPSQ
ncbi:hypothetical protein [Arthrobacter sp. E3]|uniref:hypothetical protein n=1 Tax=Arthrobacter sp. E3 TaxID=517402 RepID=UPI001A9469F0|nr:hypothetical protein [Arthrobacter sp. E3]